MGDAGESAALSIPVIDISGYFVGNEAPKRSIANQLSEACQAPGFFQIVGHGVPATLRQDLLDVLAHFYALPLETKQALHRSQSTCLRGYERVGEQMLEAGVADQKEGFMIGRERPENAGFLQGPNQWPDEHGAPRFRGVLTAYFAEMLGLSKVMFRLMALSLGLEEEYFDEFVGSENCTGIQSVRGGSGANVGLNSYYHVQSASISSHDTRNGGQVARYRSSYGLWSLDAAAAG